MGGYMCSHCHAISKIVFGALLLLNGFLWPRWLGIDGWVSWIAVLMVIWGIVFLASPRMCPRCAEVCAPTKGKK